MTKFTSAQTHLEGKKPCSYRYYSYSPKERHQALINVMGEFNYDPVVEMIKLSQCAKSEKVRCDATMHLLDRILPALKAVTHEGNVSSQFNLNITYQGKDISRNETIIDAELSQNNPERTSMSQEKLKEFLEPIKRYQSIVNGK